MWQFTVYTVLLATMLVAADRGHHISTDPPQVNILVARRLISGTYIMKLRMNSAPLDHRWIQINGENAAGWEMSYFRAYSGSFEEYRVWDYGRARYKYYGGFTKRINVCRHGDGASVITDDNCPNGLTTDFSFFVAEGQKPGTKKVYSTVCLDEKNGIGYSTLSTRNSHCWTGSGVVSSSSFYVYVGKPFCKTLRGPPGGLGTIAGQTHEHGVRVTSVTYRCSYGYNLLGSETINCGANGRWDGRLPTCEAVKCGPPPPLNHGRASRKGAFFYSNRITYKCDKGYNRYPSNAIIECQGNGRWTESAMECQPVDCRFPGSLENGKITGQLTTYGRKLKFKCNRKFARVGPKEITCQANGIWSNELPRCDGILCPPLNPIPNSRQHMLSRGLDNEVIVLCNQGYKIEGSHTLKCIFKTGSKTEADWNHPPPVCSRVTCTKPQSVENGKVFGTEYFHNSEVTYTCDTGYSLEGNNRLTCTMGNWDGEPPTCRAITCRDPGVPRHGRRTGDSMTYGSVMQFECDVDYTMLGQQSISCGEGRRWTAAKPVCEAIVCPTIGSPAHGSVELSSAESGSSAIFSCFAGYYMTGSRESRCLTSGHWSGAIPTCQACPIGYYKEGSNEALQCVQCPPNSNTSSQANFSPLHCICDSNSHRVDGGPCEVVQCPSLSAPEHGEITSCSRNYRDSCSFQCDPGYILSGYRLRTCSKTGWTGDLAICSACPKNTYKHMQGSSTCIPCPRQTTTGEILGVSIESCACAPGYHGPPGGPCQDVNECETDNGGCNQACLNTPGSFRCRCSRPGYLLSRDNKTCYMNQTCLDLQQEVGHGRTRCRYAEEENGYICYISCDPSYFFVSGINNYITCGADSGFEWSHRLVNRTAKIPACTKEFFVDMNLPISFKYRSEQSSNDLPIHMSLLESQIIQSIRTLNACGSFCEIQDFNATYSESDDGGCEATVMMGIFMKNPDVNAIAPECDPVCKRLNMREMLKGTFEMKNNVSDLVSNRPENLIVPGVAGTTVITSSFSFDRPQMLCDPGKVLSKNRLCVPCDSGYYLPNRSLQACSPCPKGTYQMLQGQIACQPCDRYTTTVTAGSDHPAMCSVRIEQEGVTSAITSTTESDAAAGDEDQSEVDPVL